MGRENALHGQANHPFMTGTGGWAYFSATRFILGLRPGFDGLTVQPCIPADWKGFTCTRVWRGTTYNITVENPHGIEKGKPVTVPQGKPGEVVDVKVVMEK
jgi:N,N'-diacetylchitobiose phosphorylase